MIKLSLAKVALIADLANRKFPEIGSLWEVLPLVLSLETTALSLYLLVLSVIHDLLLSGPLLQCLPIQNECADGSADCSRDAHCIDRADGYECKCKQGFVDASPQVDKYPGRVCNQPRPLEYYGIPQRQVALFSRKSPNIRRSPNIFGKAEYTENWI